MFKFILTHKNKYNEIPQPNPLRWRMLYKEGDVFKSQTGLIKCKDFFNDIVAAIHGKKFSIYNFDAEQVNLNQEGLWVLLSNIQDYDQFAMNVNNTVNVALGKVGIKPIYVSKQTKTRAVILLPNELFSSTFLISAVTGLIRCCNYGVSFNEWEELFTKNDSPLVTRAEKAMSVLAVEYLKTKGLKHPVEDTEMWFYAGKQQNSKQTVGYLSNQTIHNNGINGWLGALNCGF